PGGGAGDGAIRDAAGLSAADRLRRDRAALGGESVRLYLFVATLGYSRRGFVQAFRHERQSAWFDVVEHPGRRRWRRSRMAKIRDKSEEWLRDLDSKSPELSS